MSLKNWDNKTWLSSTSYIKSFNNFLLKQIKLNKNSQILDIGCGRGKILGSLSSKLSLNRKPIGIDIVKHKDRDKRIIFKKIDALKFLKKNKKKFDLILLKQTIHLFKIKDIKNILKLSKKMLNINPNLKINYNDKYNDKNKDKDKDKDTDTETETETAKIKTTSADVDLSKALESVKDLPANSLKFLFLTL